MMVTLYNDIPIYLLSLSAATWTCLVSQARNAPNSCNIHLIYFNLVHKTLLFQKKSVMHYGIVIVVEEYLQRHHFMSISSLDMCQEGAVKKGVLGGG